MRAMAASSAPNRREAEISAVRDALLLIFEQCLQAQLSAIRRLRAGKAPPETGATAAPRRRKGRSQVDMAEDILKSARTPLHISEIIARIGKTTGVQIDSESLVSALSKRVARKDRFRRTERNTFALL
jgi:hypothetical protein